MTFIFNPGSGLVAGADEGLAGTNIQDFVKDLGLEFPIEITRKPSKDARGRFGFTLNGNGNETVIEMPGLPLEQVKYMNNPDQNIWDFPRLYVDGSSWVWCYALDIAGIHLTGEDQE
jgi:hypothetical protein